MLSMYPACFFHDPDGYSVIFPDLNGLATCGDTPEEAFAMAVDCLAGYLYTCQLDGEEIPAPSPSSRIDPQAIAKQLDPEAPPCEAVVKVVSVDVAGYAREHFGEPIRKTLSLPGWLSLQAEQAGLNLSEVLQDALKERLNMS